MSIGRKSFLHRQTICRCWRSPFGSVLAEPWCGAGSNATSNRDWDGLLRDKTRPPGVPPVPQAKVHAVVERTLRAPPGAITHWTGRAMAKAMGLSLRTIQRIWLAHGLQPHRIRTFRRSTDPDFAAKLDDVVGLYMNPRRATPWRSPSTRRARSRPPTARSPACR